jgi:RHS repeat-associated protein
VETIYADDTADRYSYDVHNNRVQTVDRNGSTVACTYDAGNRLTGTSITAGTGVSNDTTFETYKYDGLSRLVYAEDDDSLVTLSYDSASNITSEKLDSTTTTSVYDGMGNKLSCTYPSGRVMTTSYDVLNRKETISDTNGPIANYDYIGPRRVERVLYGNSTECDYSYDDVKRIIATSHVFDPCGVNTAIDSRTYLWDKVYNKTQRRDIRGGGPGLIHDYAYDGIYRLVEATVTDPCAAEMRNTAYTLDGVGNRTSVAGPPNPGSYTMDAATPEPADYQMNQYTITPFDSRLYDKNGNLDTVDDGQPTQKNISYDYRNQIVEINDVNMGQVHTYAYDALGRRIEKAVDVNGTPETTRYRYDLWRMVEETDACGVTEASYVYWFGEVVAMQRDGNDYYYHSDDRGNIMAVTDGNGLAVERYEYQDYGEPNLFDGAGESIASSAIGNPYMFKGRRYDPETSLYYYGGRYLDPAAGRFIQQDAMGIWGDSANLGNGTAYAGNNPWSGRDGLYLPAVQAATPRPFVLPIPLPRSIPDGDGFGGIGYLSKVPILGDKPIPRSSLSTLDLPLPNVVEVMPSPGASSAPIPTATPWRFAEPVLVDTPVSDGGGFEGIGYLSKVPILGDKPTPTANPADGPLPDPGYSLEGVVDWRRELEEWLESWGGAPPGGCPGPGMYYPPGQGPKQPSGWTQIQGAYGETAIPPAGGPGTHVGSSGEKGGGSKGGKGCYVNCWPLGRVPCFFCAAFWFTGLL